MYMSPETILMTIFEKIDWFGTDEKSRKIAFSPYEHRYENFYISEQKWIRHQNF